MGSLHTMLTFCVGSTCCASRKIDVSSDRPGRTPHHISISKEYIHERSPDRRDRICLSLDRSATQHEDDVGQLPLRAKDTFRNISGSLSPYFGAG